MKLTRIQRYLFSVLTGVLLFLAFPYTGSLTPLAFIAWLPLLFIEDTVSTNRYKSSKVFLHAYISFLIYNVGTTWWIWNADPAGALMAFFLNSLLMVIAFQFFHISKKNLGSKLGYVALLCIWIGFEFLHYHWELSWPWLTLGNVFSIRTSWVQWYEYTGVLGGSIWILLVNIFAFKLVKAILNRKTIPLRPRKIMPIFIALLFPLTLSFSIYTGREDAGVAAEVVVIQPNIDPYQKFSSIGPAQQLYRIADIAEQSLTPNTKLVIAPETAIPISFDEAVIQYDMGYEIFKQRMESWGETQLFIGASTEKRFEKKMSRASRLDPYGGPGYVEFYNSSLLMDGKIEPEIVHKSKLVLGAEKVPFSNWFPKLEEFSLNLGGSSGTLGVESEPKNIRKGKFQFTPSICYESVYGEHTARQTRLGSQAIIVITNDGWWGNTPGYKQHFSFSRLRAIENRKSVARSANTGTSGFIDQRGNVVTATEYWKIEGLKGHLYLNSTQTLYMKIGDLLGRIAFIAGSIMFLYALFLKWFPRKEVKSV